MQAAALMTVIQGWRWCYNLDVATTRGAGTNRLITIHNACLSQSTYCANYLNIYSCRLL